VNHLSWVLALGLVLPLGAREADVDWEPDVYPHGNIFPAFLIGTARVNLSEEVFAAWGENHLGDPQGVIGVSLSGAGAGSKVEVVVKGNDYMAESRFKGTLDKDADGLLIHPKIAFKYDALARVTQAVPLAVTMAVKVDGKDLGEKTETVTLRSINDCLFGVEETVADDEKPRTSHYDWLFPAYVNENHPWVDRILKEALDTEIVSSFDGYQSGESDSVLLQIFSIWNVMQRHGLKYSNVTTTAAEERGVYSQHVRLFDESVTAAQANCVDGTVLLAAILRKIGFPRAPTFEPTCLKSPVPAWSRKPGSGSNSPDRSSSLMAGLSSTAALWMEPETKSWLAIPRARTQWSFGNSPAKLGVSWPISSG